MQFRIVAAVLVVLGLTGGRAYAGTDTPTAAPDWQAAVVEFKQPVLVNGNYLLGRYLIIHDEAKMRRGEPCTTFYRYDPENGKRKEVLSFHCIPTPRGAVARPTITTALISGDARLVTEFQFTGEIEAHGVPGR